MGRLHPSNPLEQVRLFQNDAVLRQGVVQVGYTVKYKSIVCKCNFKHIKHDTQVLYVYVAK